MKNSFISNILSARLCFVLLISFFWGKGVVESSYAQTNFYNGGTNVTIYPNTVVYVDGHVSNNTQGFIHNQGDLYLTGDWTNNEPSGCLDANTGTVVLDGTTQVIKGTQITKFNNLDCKTYGTKTLNINTIVGGNTGALALRSSPFDLNKNTLIVNNPASSAITRTSGYVISETDPTAGYGWIKWNIAATSNNYTYPFGTVSGTYIPLLYHVTSSGMELSGIGNVTVATYPTSVIASPNNRPLPTGVSDLNDKDGNESAVICADRYWVIDANNYSTNPTADITFTYRDIEWDKSLVGNTNNIEEVSLHAWMWNGTQWQNPTLGTLNSTANTVLVTNVSNSAPWTLKGNEPEAVECFKLEVPNAFSPNNDGYSDLFILQGWEKCISSLSFLIFDRWGEKVFETENVTKGWDGNYNGKAMNTAVFVYIINATFTNGKKATKKGNVSLIR